MYARATVCLGTVLATCLLLVLQAPSGTAAVNVVELTDDNFDNHTASGVWLIKIYAPWCSHCRQLEPLWVALGEDAESEGLKIGKVDGTKEKVLLTRFKVTGFPSIFLLRDGQCWSYSGPRNVDSFVKFATKGYAAQAAIPFYKAPNSVVGRLLGKAYGLPSIGRKVYRFLRHEKGFGDVTIVLGCLSIPVFTGAVLICMLDALYLRRARLEHLHEE